MPAPGLTTSTAITFTLPSGAAYSVWDEGVSENYVRNGESRAIRKIVCAWNDRVPIISAILGSATVVSGLVVYNPPITYPDAPWLILQEVRSQPLPGTHWLPTGGPTGNGGAVWTDGNVAYNADGLTVGPNGMVAAKYARLELEYRNDPQSASETGSLEFDFEVGADLAPQSASAFSFLSGDSASDPAHAVAPVDAPALLFPIMGLSWTRRNLPYLPASLAQTLSASPVNSSAITLPAEYATPSVSFPAGTLLFTGMSARRRFVGGGVTNFDVTTRLRYKAAGWNTCYSASTGSYEPIYVIGGTTGPYPTSDFSPLFS